MRFVILSPGYRSSGGQGSETTTRSFVKRRFEAERDAYGNSAKRRKSAEWTRENGQRKRQTNEQRKTPRQLGQTGRQLSLLNNRIAT